MKIKRTIASCISLMLVIVSVFSLGCTISVTPAHSVEVQNNLDKTVIINVQLFMNGEWDEMENFGKVDAGKTRAVFSMIAPTSKSGDSKYRVEARDLSGELIKSWEFVFQERILLKIDGPDIPK